MLLAGRLKQRVTLQRQTISKDARGVDVATWVDLATVWAQVQMIGGSEAVQTLQTTAKTHWQVNIRYRFNLTTADRILYSDGSVIHTLAIVAIIDKYQARDELELTCTESA